jgi:DNA polymerase-4
VSAKVPFPPRLVRGVVFFGHLCLTGKGKGKGKGRMRTTATLACLVIPHLALRLALQQHPTLAGTPLAISTNGEVGTRGTLIDCSPEARALGLRVGMPAREAQNLCPELTVLPDNPLRVASMHQKLLRALYQVCPTLQRGMRGCIYLDLQGLERHYASVHDLGAALLACADPGFAPRIALASSTFVAFVAARRSRAGVVRVVSQDEQRQLLERCPVELLPLPPATLRRMERLGLQRLGDISRLPLTALVAQFGADGRRAWYLARGDDLEPFRAEAVTQPIIELLRLPAATILAGDLVVACRIAASRLLARPAVRGQAIRRLRLDLLLEHGGTRGRTILIKDGTRDQQRLVALLASHLAQLSLDAPVVAVQLDALELGAAPPYQPTLGATPSRPVTRLRGAITELTQRYGTSPLYQVVEVNRWARLPEHRWALATYEP